MFIAIFLSIILFITGFLLVNYNNNQAALKKSVLHLPSETFAANVGNKELRGNSESSANLSNQLGQLMEKLEEKKTLCKTLHDQIATISATRENMKISDEDAQYDCQIIPAAQVQYARQVVPAVTLAARAKKSSELTK